MSLIVGSRFTDGILLASDSFVFDNDGELPLKTARFDRFHVFGQGSCVVMAIGSRWVFDGFIAWLDSTDGLHLPSVDDMAAKWTELNHYWKTERVSEISRLSGDTLRPLSDSTLIMARTGDLGTVWIASGDRDVVTTSSFVIAGSGSYLVEMHLRRSAKTFRPADSLSQCLALMQECYEAAAMDLYVLGQPAIAIVQADRIIDLSHRCAEIALECHSKYFADLEKAVVHASQALPPSTNVENW